MTKNRIYRSSFAASLLVLLASAALAQGGVGVDPRYAELPNFHTVAAGKFYRGGQPKAGGLSRLASLGVKTIINLRDDDSHAVEEEREARSLGMRYFNVPLSLGGRPAVKRVEEVLALVEAPQNQPAFVHCRKGADRTGVVAGAYRVSRDGWSAEQAQREADEYGMGWWQRGKKDFIRDYDRDHGGASGDDAGGKEHNPRAKTPARPRPRT